MAYKKTSSAWKSKGHYLKDGTEWKGFQHAMPNGEIHTGKIHKKNRQRLYHYKELSVTARKKVKLK